MSYLFWGTIALFASTLIFYAVFASLVFYWREKMTTVVVVPLIYTFEFFVIAFLVIFSTAFLLDYLPSVVEFIVYIINFIFGFGTRYSSS